MSFWWRRGADLEGEWAREQARSEHSVPPITERLELPVREFWLERIRASNFESYAGITIQKLPEDLRTYEHLLWTTGANAVIEIGSNQGGSALWFRDRLAAYARYRPLEEIRVISVDLDVSAALENLRRVDPSHQDTIRIIEGNVLDPGLVERVRSLLPKGARCLVIDDSAHSFETTTAALLNFATFVPVGGLFVVEDGCVDIESMRMIASWPRGVLPAVADWLASEQGSAFKVRRDLERYGLTSHPHGYLERIRPAAG